MVRWKPAEIIVNELVKDDPTTRFIQDRCHGAPVGYVQGGGAGEVMNASELLSNAGNSMLERILAGKQVVYIAPATNLVDVFTMPDDRMVCPHFDRLKLASNGCYYQCDWCYLKLTYRAAFPFITVRAQYHKIKKQLEKRLGRAEEPIMFNSGELADSLSMEHLTRAAQEFIPWFGQSDKGFLFMLTKSGNVDDILDLPHNGHTIIAWSMNNEEVSTRFEIGAPRFERRLQAAQKVQDAGYPIRVRLDPIVPIEGWQQAYANTIRIIFEKISPERITIGTLRFEEAFYNMRHKLLTTGPYLLKLMEEMEPMFPPKVFPGSRKPKSGKYSFSVGKRIEIFSFVIDEIRKYSDCRIALCKESADVWDMTGLPLSKCSCVCQLDYADQSRGC